MERRNSYSRLVYVPTSAARVASVKNNRETLLLARASKGLSSESNGTLRSFYRERTKANSYLQNVQSKSAGMLKAKHDKDGKVTDEDGFDEKIGVITRNEVRDIMKVQRIRRASLDVTQTEETQRRIQAFLTRDIPGGRSRNEHLQGQLNGISEKNVARYEDGEQSLQDHKEANVQTPKPFRVRSRSSGICFSCSHAGPLHSLPPSTSVPNIPRRCSEENAPWKSSKTPFRKLSVPMAGQVTLNQNRIYDVNTPHLPSVGSNITSTRVHITRSSLKRAPTRKHSI